MLAVPVARPWKATRSPADMTTSTSPAWSRSAGPASSCRRRPGQPLHALRQGELPLQTEPPVLHGRSLHWTRTVAGKTVIRTLTPEQAEHCQPWFDNARRLREALTELEARSLKVFLDAEG